MSVSVHSAILKNCIQQPINSTLYCSESIEEQIFKQEVERMFYKNVINTTQTKWADPILLSVKKDGLL